MSDSVKGSRRYHSPRRARQAAETRRAVLVAAREQLVGKGYAATTVADIARAAGVAVDTVYATIGRKPALLRELVEVALSGEDEPVPALRRDYVRRARAAPTAAEKLSAYADGMVELQPRLAPIFLALRDAAVTDADCAALWTEIAERRAANMRMFAADLRATGELREDLSDGEVADIIWSMNAAEYYTLLVHDRGWTAQRYGAWLVDAWTRLLLDHR
ncbi:MAG: TetR family transcriptional regulator [Actinophytocola sp.]|uniref:TetR/AcrR family transcriptional regulator n=1 Tax=Actinophytocola sp. TaxID=1872138 RepID=UPI0013278ABE|nr:TetR/AcrR family transcriptional regulator [Actinophytocola sp.]MPZ82168.1 TetR family transcriptional regulator [Actinophytocola sp.]